VELNPLVTAAVNNALEVAERGDTKKAMAALTDLLIEHPRSHDVAFGIGCIHASCGGHEKAIEWFDKAIAIYPYSLESYYNRGVAYQKLMDLPNCIRSYQKVITMGDPADREVIAARLFIADSNSIISETTGISLDLYLEAGDHFSRAFALMERGQWEEALEGFQASAAINGKNPSCHGNMGLCHASLGRKAMALAELDRALAIDPDYQPARGNREVVEKMREGTPLENATFQGINYGLEKSREGS
jgi:tetratricopeptide (TPR) repeat protein